MISSPEEKEEEDTHILEATNRNSVDANNYDDGDGRSASSC